MLNPLRNQEKYAGDPLAPANWPIESVFASVMLGSPLGWFEASGLAPETVSRLAPFVATWKLHRDRLHAGVVHPVGEKPDGVAWTGFVVKGAEGLDVVLFRELNAKRDFTIDLGPFGSASSAEVLSPRGHASVKDGVLSVDVPDALDFVWASIR